MADMENTPVTDNSGTRMGAGIGAQTRGIARLCLWLSVTTVVIVGLGLAVLAVGALAHHAAPVGGGG